jgi:tyrosine-protein kinase Etk/Wzc
MSSHNTVTLEARDHDPSVSREEPNTLLDLLLVASSHKKLVSWIIGGGMLATIFVLLIMPPTFTAEAKLMPPQQNQSIANVMLGQLGPLAALAGKDLLQKNPAELYVTMLKSETIANHLIQKYQLMSVYKAKKMVDAREELEDRTDIALNVKDGVITLKVDDKDPNRAAQIANSYIDELRDLTQKLAVSEASQRRLFYENQLQAAKQNLANAEVDLRRTQETTGLIQIESQARAMIQSIASLRAEIAAREIQLQSMRSFATADNPDVKRLETEIAAARGQLAKLERDDQHSGTDVMVPTGQVPRAGLEYLRKYREVKYYETIYELLAKQFEAAKLDESKNAAIVQVLDPANVPERRSKPKRALLSLVALIVLTILAILVVALWEAVEKFRRNPESMDKLVRLRLALRT